MGRPSLFWVVTQYMLVVYYRRFGQPIGSETKEINYSHTLRNYPARGRPQGFRWLVLQIIREFCKKFDKLWKYRSIVSPCRMWLVWYNVPSCHATCI